MTPNSRPVLSLPDIIAEAFTQYVRNLRTFVLLTIPGAVVFILVSVGEAQLVRSTGILDTAGGAHVVAGGTAAIVLTSIVASAFLVACVSDAFVVPAALAVILGKRLDLRQVWRAALLALPAVLVAWLIITVTMALFWILFPLAIFVLIRWSLFIQAICDRRVSAIHALRESWALVRGHWWRVTLVQVALNILAILPALAVRPFSSNLGNAVMGILLSTAAWWIAAPFTAIGRTLLYVDLRARKGEQVQSPPPLPATIEDED